MSDMVINSQAHRYRRQGGFRLSLPEGDPRREYYDVT